MLKDATQYLFCFSWTNKAHRRKGKNCKQKHRNPAPKTFHLSFSLKEEAYLPSLGNLSAVPARPTAFSRHPSSSSGCSCPPGWSDTGGIGRAWGRRDHMDTHTTHTLTKQMAEGYYHTTPSQTTNKSIMQTHPFSSICEKQFLDRVRKTNAMKLILPIRPTKSAAMTVRDH